MSNPWSIKGIDPKAREAAREKAKRAGMTLGEWVNQAILAPADGGGAGLRLEQTLGDRTEGHLAGDSDWRAASPTEVALQGAAIERLAQRLDHAEERQQLTVKGLDRAVSQLDKAMTNLAGRIDQTETGLKSATAEVLQAIEEARTSPNPVTLAAMEEVKAQLAATEEAALRQAQSALAEARSARSELSDRLDLIERATVQERERLASPLADLRTAQAALAQKLAEVEASGAGRDSLTMLEQAQAALAKRLDHVLADMQTLTGDAVRDVRTLEATLADRLAAAEAAAREASGELRQATGAAISDLRNAHLSLTNRLTQIEAGAGSAGAIKDLEQTQAALASRLEALDGLEARTRALEAAAHAPHPEVETLERNLSDMAARLDAAQTGAAEAIRMLEQKVAEIDQKAAESAGLSGEAASVRALLDQRLGELSVSMTAMVDGAKAELHDKVAAAIEGLRGNDLEGALADVNRRLAGAERRQAQTIEAISIEIKRLSDGLDRRIRAVEERNDTNPAVAAVREDVERLTASLEARFSEISQREAAAFDRMGNEIGKLSERMDNRFATADSRSAQAIEQLGDQMSRVADRMTKRQDQLAHELGERLVQSEERQTSRLSETLAALAQRMAETEERASDAVSPVQKAMQTLAGRLQAIEDSFSATTGLSAGPRPPAPSAIAEPTPAVSPGWPTEGRATAPPIAPPPAMQKPASTGPDQSQTAGLLGAFDPPEYSPFDDDQPAAASSWSTPPPPVDNAETAAPDDLSTDMPLWDDMIDDPPVTADAADTVEYEPADSPNDLEQIFGGGPSPLDPPDAQFDGRVGSGRNDFLSNARRAAQAQANGGSERPGKVNLKLPPRGAKASTDASGPAAGLRGLSRYVLWGAAGALALAVAGGTYFLAQPGPQPEAAQEPEPPPQTDAGATAQIEVAAVAIDPAMLAPGGFDEPLGTPPPVPVGDVPLEGRLADVATGLTPAAVPAPRPVAAPPTGPAAGDARTPAPQAPPRPVPSAARPAPAPAAVAQASRPAAGPVAMSQATPAIGPQARIEQAAAAGNAVAQYQLGLQLMAGPQKAEGLSLLRRAANQGMAMAQYRLAKAYETGDGVEASITQARQWTERAAAGGNRAAMHDLGVFFARGEGAPLDQATAFRWFRQAADLGVPDSQFNIGVLYERGQGTAANPSEALFWFLVAARSGDDDARARAAALEANLSATQVRQIRERADQFRPRPANPRANGDFGPVPWGQPAT